MRCPAGLSMHCWLILQLLGKESSGKLLLCPGKNGGSSAGRKRRRKPTMVYRRAVLMWIQFGTGLFKKCTNFQIVVSDSYGRIFFFFFFLPQNSLIIRFKQHRPTRNHISGMAASVVFCIVWRSETLSLIASNCFHLLVPLSPVDQFGFCLIYTKSVVSGRRICSR